MVTLSDKHKFFGSKNPICYEEDDIQKTINEIRKEAYKHMKSIKYIEGYKFFCEIIQNKLGDRFT